MAAQTDWKALFCLSLLWWALLPLIGFVGDFPLNDDWAYAQNVYHLSEKNEIYFSDWPAMTLISQTFFGAFFCKIFGFSFTVLRFSTLFIAWLGGCFGYLLLRRLGAAVGWSFVAILVWWFNPLFFSLAYTFMTEVHFLSLSILAAYFFLVYLQTQTKLSALLTLLFVAAVVLLRQTGIFLPIAFAFTLLMERGWGLRNLLKAALPVVFALLVLVLYTYWREQNYGLPPPYGNISALFKGIFHGVLFANLKDRPAVLFFYLGYFLLPLLPVLMAIVWKKSSKKMLFFAHFFVALFFIYWIFIQNVGQYIPIGNVFYSLGLGPKVLMDTHYEQNIDPVFSPSLFMGFKIVGWLAAYFLASLWVLIMLQARYLLALRQYRAWFWGNGLAALACFIYLMVDNYFFDRYFLGLNFFVLLGCLPLLPDAGQNRLLLGLSLLIALPWAWFGLAATHDYLAWNRSRWQALDYLTDTLQLSPHQIDGGFEFNAWHKTHPERIKKPHSTDWWFVDKDDYAISFGQVRNYQKMKTYAYNAWLLGFVADSVFIMKKPMPSRVDTFLCDMERLDSTGNFLSNQEGFFFAGGAARDSRYARSGAYALCMGGNYNYSLDLILPKGKAYDEFILSAWVYDQETRWGGLHSHTLLAATAADAKTFFHATHYNILDSAGWHYKEHRIVIPPDYPDSTVHFFIWQNDTDSVWIDDWQIRRITY